MKPEPVSTNNGSVNDNSAPTALLPKPQEENNSDKLLVESKQQFTSPITQDEDDDDKWIVCGDKSGQNNKTVKQGKMAAPVKQQPSTVKPAAPVAPVAPVTPVTTASMEVETISLRKSLY